MTKYSCRMDGEGMALFAHNSSMSAIHEYAKTLFEAYDDEHFVDVIDLDTGEVIFEFNPNEPEPDVDESSYNPYMGCDEIEDDRLDDFFIESDWQY